MLVVADTSPFIGLLKIGHVGVLPALYQSVTIPTEVAFELGSSRRPPEVRAFINTSPGWLSIRTASKIEAIAGIDPGECAAISLAQS